MLADFKCEHCGNEEKDVLIKKSDEEIICKICDTIMTRIYSGTIYKVRPETKTKVPPNLVGKGGVNFGRIHND